jgi:hypothetical protein
MPPEYDLDHYSDSPAAKPRWRTSGPESHENHELAAPAEPEIHYGSSARSARHAGIQM